MLWGPKTKNDFSSLANQADTIHEHEDEENSPKNDENRLENIGTFKISPQRMSNDLEENQDDSIINVKPFKMNSDTSNQNNE